MIIETLESLRQFRQTVYQQLHPSRDAAFEIIDAIAASRDARSAVEISFALNAIENQWRLESLFFERIEDFHSGHRTISF